MTKKLKRWREPCLPPAPCGSPAFRGGGDVRILGTHSFTCPGVLQALIPGHMNLSPPNSSCPLRSHLLGRVASRTTPPSPRYDQFEG